MFIGNLEIKDLRFTRMGTDIETVPTSIENGIYTWSYGVLSDTGLDIHIELGRECYVGTVKIPLQPPKASVYSAEVISEGKIVGRYAAETGKIVYGTITVEVGAVAKELIIRLYSSTEEMVFAVPEITACYDDSEPFLWPRAKKMQSGCGKVKIKEITSDGSEDGEYVKNFLHNRLKERFGDCFDAGGVPVTIRCDASEDYDGERFTVSVRSDGVLVTAKKRLTLLYAALALLDITDGGELPIIEIDDKPTKEMRGVHIGMPKRENLSFVKRLFEYVFLPLRYNHIIVQFCGGVRYDSHPEIAEAYLEAVRKFELGLAPRFPHDYMACEGTVLEKHEVSDMLAYARELGFEIIPELQTLGHVQWVTNAHPEISEREENDKIVTDTSNEDLRPTNFYTHCYCPSNEKSYEIMFDLLDEIIEMAKPERYVHMGHDEVYHLGLCEKCKKIPHHELFARDIMRYYTYLKSKGLNVAIWSDMLQPVTQYQTYPAINLVPKDILMLDFIWYFHLKEDIEENLFADGYHNVMIGNLYSSHFPRYTKRMMNENLLGGQVSLWCAMNERAMAEKGKFFELQYTSELLWNPEKYTENMRSVYNYVISRKIQPRMRDELRGVYSLSGYEEYDIKLPSGSKKGIPSALLEVCPDTVIADGASVNVANSFDRLVFEQATLMRGQRNSWKPLIISGVYTIEYEDGTREELPVRYSGNVQWLKAKYGMPLFEANYRHDGYIATWQCDPAYETTNELGEALLISGHVWENPHPDKKILTVSYKADEADFAVLILAGLKGFKKR
ncbi:MAG: family 20 glycosylhydrolase [Clostridia bacterium]|nr:family 20 glycosylhydrolase [Clostridia bacterium]